MNQLPPQLLFTLDDNHYRNLGSMESSDALVVVHSADVPAGYIVPLHAHKRSQFLCAFSGVVLVASGHGRWLVPPGHALLIPPGLQHSVEMLSDVSMKSVYIMPGSGHMVAAMPRVLEVTDLARALLLEAIRLREAPAGGTKATLVLSLLTEEVATLPERPLGLPFPAHSRLAALCRAYVEDPASDARIDDWAEKLAMSRRTFTRLFRKETGVSFITWRQQASVFACLPRLSEGLPVTQVALEAGYENAAAFTTMFRRMMGKSPRAYSQERAAFAFRLQ